MDKRRKNANWIVTSDGSVTSWDQVQVALLMDLRDELQRLTAILSCPRFMAIPSRLEDIERNTRPKKRRHLKLKRRKVA